MPDDCDCLLELFYVIRQDVHHCVVQYDGSHGWKPSGLVHFSYDCTEFWHCLCQKSETSMLPLWATSTRQTMNARAGTMASSSWSAMHIHRFGLQSRPYGRTRQWPQPYFYSLHMLVGVFAGKTVWSTLERLRGEVLTPTRYTNLRLPLPLPTKHDRRETVHHQDRLNTLCQRFRISRDQCRTLFDTTAIKGDYFRSFKSIFVVKCISCRRWLSVWVTALY